MKEAVSALSPVEEFPFHAWEAAPQVMSRMHVHTDIELNLVLSGRGRYFLAGRFHEVTEAHLAVFWAGLPHRLVAVAPGTRYLCMTLPLAWFLGWNIDTVFTGRLLQGDLLQEVAEELAMVDQAVFSRWAVDLGTRRADLRRVVLLEVEARLRRLALSASSAKDVQESVSSSRGKREIMGEMSSRGRQMERMADFVARHFRDPLTVGEIAEAVRLNPQYAMTAFKDGCDMTLWEYLTRLRVSHAQRLLLTTDWTVQHIALECGFGSPGRFFAAFRRFCGCTPREYRHR